MPARRRCARNAGTSTASAERAGAAIAAATPAAKPVWAQVPITRNELVARWSPPRQRPGTSRLAAPRGRMARSGIWCGGHCTVMPVPARCTTVGQW